MTYKENSNVFLNNNRRYLTSWANEIYVGTQYDGVFYTDDFLDPSIQPTWTAINTGLASNSCKELQLDPFNQSRRQFVLIDSGSTEILYRRYNGGNWVEIFNNTEAGIMAGGTSHLAYFCIDESVQGRLWVSVSVSGGGHAAYTDNYGDSWIDRHIWAGYNYGIGQIRAYGDIVYVPASIGAGGTGVCWYSTNRGTSWDYTIVEPYNAVVANTLNPLTPYKTYTGGGVLTGTDLLEVYSYSGKTVLQSTGPSRSDALWFHPTDANQQRIIKSGGLYSTDNAWASLNTFVNITPNPYMIAPWASNDTNKMFVGTYTVGVYHHKIATLDNATDATATGIAGTNCNTPPYTDSIPDTYGDICADGIQAVRLPANDNTYGMRIFECEG